MLLNRETCPFAIRWSISIIWLSMAFFLLRLIFPVSGTANIIKLDGCYGAAADQSDRLIKGPS